MGEWEIIKGSFDCLWCQKESSGSMSFPKSSCDQQLKEDQRLEVSRLCGLCPWCLPAGTGTPTHSSHILSFDLAWFHYMNRAEGLWRIHFPQGRLLWWSLWCHDMRCRVGRMMNVYLCLVGTPERKQLNRIFIVVKWSQLFLSRNDG